MPFCQNCGNQVAEGFNVCPNCGQSIMQPQQAYQQYPPQQQQPMQQPMQPTPMPPPAGGPSKGPLLIGVVVAVVVVIIVAVFAMMMLGGNGNGKTVTMTAKELMDDITYTEDTWGYKSLKPGDTLKIKDEIIYIASEYDDWYEETVTYFWFKSEHKNEDIDDWYDSYWNEYEDYDITFKGDLTDDFEEGDEVIITLHCIKVEKYGYEREVFREVWDEKEETFKLPTKDIIEKA
ncbi:MAG: zinc ribbon domain-containing protein [Thermoplasmata archaeon]|nr:MAG: zinc ribbon domain-containing protein [Thermoplasmata archaeon]